MALERRRERNRLAQRKHRQNAKGTKGTRSRAQSSESNSATEQNNLADNHNTDASISQDYTMDASHNLDMLAPGYSHIDIDLASTTMPLDLSLLYTDTVFPDPNKPTVCATCHACAQPHYLSPVNTPTQPIQPTDAEITPSTNTTWTTPLHISVTRGHLSAVRLLLDRGADPNALDGEGSSVLHTAVRCGHYTIVRELLRHHANPGAVDAAGWLPLHYAAEAGDEDCLRALLQSGGSS
ncbi:hypothetical protein AWENTII_001676 [Aspergillus wentii]